MCFFLACDISQLIFLKNQLKGSYSFILLSNEREKSSFVDPSQLSIIGMKAK